MKGFDLFIKVFIKMWSKNVYDMFFLWHPSLSHFKGF